MVKVAKNKDCTQLSKWLRSIKNHIYWTAASSTTPQERVAKWTSILNHVLDIHTHDDPAFPQCLHPLQTTRDNKEWLKPGDDFMTFYYLIYVGNQFNLYSLQLHMHSASWRTCLHPRGFSRMSKNSVPTCRLQPLKLSTVSSCSLPQKSITILSWECCAGKKYCKVVIIAQFTI